MAKRPQKRDKYGRFKGSGRPLPKPSRDSRGRFLSGKYVSRKFIPGKGIKRPKGPPKPPPQDLAEAVVDLTKRRRFGMLYEDDYKNGWIAKTFRANLDPQAFDKFCTDHPRMIARGQLAYFDSQGVRHTRMTRHNFITGDSRDHAALRGEIMGLIEEYVLSRGNRLDDVYLILRGTEQQWRSIP